MQEIWLPIIIEKNGIIYDYTGLYEVSNLGRVKCLNYKRSGKSALINLSPNKEYLRARLHKNGQWQEFQVHRLVATAFIPNPENLPLVNHKDENKHNNCVDNLEWCDKKYNTNYGNAQQKRLESRRNNQMFKEKKVD